MISEKLTRLKYLCHTIPALLTQINEVDFSNHPSHKWSKKQILGHLIDSATNNHHRWIRAQFENIPLISYDQNKWNEFHYYNEIPIKQLISFWTAYNLQIVSLMTVIPEENLQKQCNTGSRQATLAWLFNDYVDHLEHHLKQLADY